MGDKIRARNLMAAAGVPVAPGTTEPVADADAAVAAADEIGYPVMVKAAAGGGGIGMSAAHDADALRKAFETARTRAERFFGSPEILLERYLPRARHVEVQILGLADGRVVALGERDCSVQRRHQKVAEETPSPGISAELRAQMLAAAVRAGEAVGYLGAGTVECLVDAESGTFVFLEMNTRLQVEHPVTELVTGIDLVEQQFLIAAGEPVSFDPSAPVRPRGHAIELRVYAEDPKRFLPSPGAITAWQEPSGPGVRVDSGYAAGTTVTPFYDPLLAKLCAHGATRDEAIARARLAVADFVVTGPEDQPAVPRRAARQRRVRQRRLRHRSDRPYAPGVIGSSTLPPVMAGEKETAVAEVRAEMVANVWKVLVSEGDHVDDGDTLVILESMKMEIPILAEESGTVTKLHVAEGDVVQEDELIAEIG